MSSHKFISRLDRIGMTASTLCAIHCAAVPLLITVLPLMGMGFLANPFVEWGMIILSLIIGLSSISLSYFRVHRRLQPALTLVCGFLVIMAGHALVSGWLEAVIVPCGGLIVALAHFMNYKYAGACKNAAHLSHLKLVSDEKN